MHGKDEKYVRNFARENIRRRQSRRYDGNVNADYIELECVEDWVDVSQYRVES